MKRVQTYFVLFSICIFAYIPSFAQKPINKRNKVSSLSTKKSPQSIPLKRVLKIIEKKYDIYFLFDSELIEEVEVVYERQNYLSLQAELKAIFKDTYLKTVSTSQDVYIISPAFSNAYIQGKVLDPTGEKLHGATLRIQKLAIGSISDEEGRFFIQLPWGRHSLEGHFWGLEGIKKEIFLRPGDTLDLDMQFSAYKTLEKVVITGSRIKPRTTVSSPVPIDNIEAEVIDRQGNGDLTENLKNIIPAYTAAPLTGDGSAFVRPTSFRGLAPDQTLVLVNSKRRHRSSVIAHFGAAMNAGAHAVDIAHIPVIALKNLEVLRDGAAAQYGSDAIAGVFNFILKDANKGAEVQTQIGKWYGGNYGSEKDYKVAANVGLPLTSKGFFNFSGEYHFNEELSRGIQHADAIGVPGAPDPAMNWGRPQSKGFRSVWNAGMELNGKQTVYSFGNFATTSGNYSFFYRPPNLRGVLTPLPLDPQDSSLGNFSWGDEFPAGFTPRIDGLQTDFSAVIGIKGKLLYGINYDFSSSFGHNRMNYVVNGSLNPSWGPQSQRTFHPGDLQQNERNLNLDFHKELGEKLNLAAGLQTRTEMYTMYEGDPQSYTAGPWAGVGNLIDPISGLAYHEPEIGANGWTGTSRENAGEYQSNSWGGYLDLEYDISEAFLVQFAYRYEDYVEFGSTNTYKIAARYSLADWLTLRGGYSTGFRAPTPGQANVVTITTSFDGASGKQVQEGTVSPTNPIAVQLGGKALVPEASRNLNIGMASKISDNLRLTLDYYHIHVKDRIVKSRSLPIYNPLFSELAFYTNSLNVLTYGLDAVLSWRNARTNVNLAYNYNVTDVISQEQVNGMDPVSEGTIFNLENNLPRHKVNLYIYHDFGKMGAMFRANYYSKTIDERRTREEIGDETLIDVELSYPATEKIKLILGANNLLDNYPDRIETRLSQGMPYPRRSPIGYHGGMVYFRAVMKI